MSVYLCVSILRRWLHVSVLAWATITQYYGLDDLNNRHLFLTVLETEKSKIKMLHFVRAFFLLCRWPSSHSTITWLLTERALVPSSYQETKFHYRCSNLRISTKPDYLPKSLPQCNAITLGALIYEFKVFPNI
jgi:hypothetical protein